MITDAQYAAWLKDQTASRCTLIEINVGLAAGGSTIRYLSTKTFVTGVSDTPANTSYIARVQEGIKFTRAIDPVAGTVSTSFGDLAIDNTDGALDSWFLDYWNNRTMKIYIGDTSWGRSDFRLVYTGTTLSVDTSDRNTVNLILTDNLQRLATPISTAVIGGTTALANTFAPLLFGECHNISPVSIDSTINKYQIHNGPIERIIEVRDNGVPVSFSQNLAAGEFTLTNQPYGTVTCSAQGAQIPTNIVLASEDLSNAPVWGGGTLAMAVTYVGTGGPYAGVGYSSLVPDTSTGLHWISVDTNVTVNVNYTMSAFVQAVSGGGSLVSMTMQDHGSNGQLIMTVNLATGVGTATINSYALAHGGFLTSSGCVPVGGGWYKIWITGCPTSASTITNTFIQLYSSTGATHFAGNGTQAYANVTGVQLEFGTYPTSYITAPVYNASVYRNTISELMRFLAVSYGTTGLNFANSELNIPAMVQFDCLHRQPVGIYITDGTTTVLDNVTALTTSLGAQPLIDSSGLLSIVQLNLPQSLPGTSVGPSDMVEKSLLVYQLPLVEAGVLLGYCKNWTVQDTIAGGVDASSAALFDTEYLTVTRSDSAAAANYNQAITTTEVDTLLLVGADAIGEANRRLNIYNIQRRIINYSGFWPLMTEQLGAPQTLTNSRFGLSGGATGQIISIVVDFTSPHIDFEVLV